eukprot:461247-Rhodomonas_salina.1
MRTNRLRYCVWEQTEQGQELAAHHKMEFFETSAKVGTAVQDVFSQTALQVLSLSPSLSLPLPPFLPPSLSLWRKSSRNQSQATAAPVVVKGHQGEMKKKEAEAGGEGGTRKRGTIQ